MNKTENINELVAALSKAQGMMEPARFNKKNPHFKSKYADFTSCMEACRKPLADNGLCIMQYCETTEDSKLKLVTMLAHVSGQWIKSCLPLNDLKTCQTFGSEITYMKRYGLSAMLGIVADEDENADDDGEISIERSKAALHPIIPFITPQQVHVLMGLACKVSPDQKVMIDKWMVDNAKAKSFQELTDPWFEKILTTLNNCIKFNEQKVKDENN